MNRNPKSVKKPAMPKHYMGIVLTPELREAIEVLAMEEGRSLSSIIRRLLDEAVRARFDVDEWETTPINTLR